MDIYCPVCGEPFDTDEFHDMAASVADRPRPLPSTVGAMYDRPVTYRSLVSDFKARGCKVLEPFMGPQPNCKPTGEDREALIRAVYDIAADEDDAAGMFEDFGIRP